MEYSFLFPLMQKLWKSIKKCKTYSRKATGLFFTGHGVSMYYPTHFVWKSGGTENKRMLWLRMCYNWVDYNEVLLYLCKQADWQTQNKMLLLSYFTGGGNEENINSTFINTNLGQVNISEDWKQVTWCGMNWRCRRRSMHRSCRTTTTAVHVFCCIYLYIIVHYTLI